VIETLENVVLRPATRLAAGTLLLALPLAGAAGCGAEKRRTIKAEFASAQTNFENSKAASITLRFDDSKGTASKLATKDGNTSKALVDALLHGSVTYVVDPASDATLKSLSTKGGTSSKSLSDQLKKVNLAFVVRDSSAVLGEIRLVAGVLYAHVDLTEIGKLAKAGGVKDFDSKLDDAITSAGPQFATGIADVRAGKWIKLPIASYVDKLQDLAKSFTPGRSGGTTKPPAPTNAELTDLGNKVFAAVKPYVKVTDANDSSKDRVLDVNVKVRPALKAVLAVLQGSKGLPFAGFLKSVTPAEIDKKITDGSAHGTITLKSGHLTQVTLDVESIRTLDATAGKDSLEGSSVVLDFNDHADEVKVPTDVSAFDVGALIDQFLQGFGQSFGSSTAPLAG
jgi:hypothetical protein